MGKEGESTNYLLFVDDLKLCGKDESELDSLAFIEKQDVSPLCKMCGEKEETDAVRRRRWITVRGTKLHEFTGTSQENIGNEAKVLWPQTGKKVIESNNGQLLWDYSTQTDREMKDQT